MTLSAPEGEEEGGRNESEQVRIWAGKLRESLAEICAEAVVAGSVRRGKEDPHDAEIVARLHPPSGGLFGDSVPEELPLVAWMVRNKHDGVFDFDMAVKRRGPKYWRFVLGEATGIPGFVFELFLAEPGQFGNTLAIRTGDADFSRLLVTPRMHGGLMPLNMRQSEGYLWRKGPDSLTTQPDQLYCPTEEAFFAALGLEWVPLELRNADGARRLAGQQRMEMSDAQS